MSTLRTFEPRFESEYFVLRTTGALDLPAMVPHLIIRVGVYELLS